MESSIWIVSVVAALLGALAFLALAMHEMNVQGHVLELRQRRIARMKSRAEQAAE